MAELRISSLTNAVFIFTILVMAGLTIFAQARIVNPNFIPSGDTQYQAFEVTFNNYDRLQNLSSSLSRPVQNPSLLDRAAQLLADAVGVVKTVTSSLYFIGDVIKVLPQMFGTDLIPNWTVYMITGAITVGIVLAVASITFYRRI